MRFDSSCSNGSLEAVDDSYWLNPLGLNCKVFGCRLQPIVLEASYTPKGEPRTPLQQAAIDAGCEVIDGLQMLVEQGVAQWELWTGQVR